MACELEFDQQEFKVANDFRAFRARKAQLLSSDLSNNFDVVDVKIYDSVFDEKSSFNMLRLTFSS